MKVIKSDTGFLAYQKLLSYIQQNSVELLLWQVNADGERNKISSIVNSYHIDTGFIHLESRADARLDPQLPIYCYSDQAQFIFKSQIAEVRESVVSVMMPAEIHLLEDPEVNYISGKIGVDFSPWRTKRLGIFDDTLPDYVVVKSMAQRSSRDQEFLNNEFNSVSLDEEDKLFADKRESPRARPKDEKWVKVLPEGQNESLYLKLFDLSRGGISFITDNPNVFPKGSQVRVVGFFDFDLDDPLIAKVMSQRNMDDSVTDFKIGCKFDEGQQ